MVEMKLYVSNEMRLDGWNEVEWLGQYTTVCILYSMVGMMLDVQR